MFPGPALPTHCESSCVPLARPCSALLLTVDLLAQASSFFSRSYYPLCLMLPTAFTLYDGCLTWRPGPVLVFPAPCGSPFLSTPRQLQAGMGSRRLAGQRLRTSRRATDNHYQRG